MRRVKIARTIIAWRTTDTLRRSEAFETTTNQMRSFARFILFVCVGFASGTAIRAQDAGGESLSNKYKLADSVSREYSAVYASDTVAVKHDIDVYKRLERKASKRKLIGRLFSLIVSIPGSSSEENEQKAIHEEYLPYEGRIVKDIRIIVLSPFGTDINRPDSSSSAGWLESTANKLHISTKHYAIKDNLPFRKGEKIDPLTIAEAEVFLRNTTFINDARIRIDSIPGTDEAEITVIVRDVWPIGFEVGEISASKTEIEIYDKNFLGVGNNAYLRGMYRLELDKRFGYGFGYRYYNLCRSFVNLGGYYHDEIVAKSFELSAERPLRTNTEFFGQIAYSGNVADIHYAVWDSVTPTRIDNFSLSVGYAFAPVDKYTDGRLAFALRYFDENVDFIGVNYDIDSSTYRYVPSKTALMQISLYRQEYYREYLVHAFGTTENIAYGYNFSGQIGYNRRPRFERYGIYASLKVAAGKRFDFGNLFAQGAVSSYFDKKSAYGGVLGFKLKYFSPLASIGRNRFRFLLNFNYSKGLNPVHGFGDYLYFGQMSTMGTERFNSTARGTERLMFNVENNIFTPWNLMGFRCMIFSFLDMGWISNQNLPLVCYENLYWGTGLGIRIRNDLLVFRTLEIKLGWYPRLNQSGFDNFIKFSSSTPTVSDDFVPKYPEVIPLSF